VTAAFVVSSNWRRNFLMFVSGYFFYSAFWNFPAWFITVLSYLLRESICNFVTMKSDMSFQTFKFYSPVIFVQFYCSLPNFF
jgi:hypothetical protein